MILMTSATTFTIDGSLAPSDAAQVLEDFRAWLRSRHGGMLDIAPVPTHPLLPTQPAIQMLFIAIQELKTGGNAEYRLTSRVGDMCRRLGQAKLVGKHEPEDRNG